MCDIVRFVRLVRNVRVVQGVRIGLIVLAALIQSDGPTHAQGSGILVRHRAPTDRALDFQLAALQAEFGDMKAQKRASTRLVEGGTFSMNARYLTGAEAAQIHKSITEFYFVRDGSATLVTGGTIVNNAIRGGSTASSNQATWCSFRRACRMPFAIRQEFPI